MKYKPSDYTSKKVDFQKLAFALFLVLAIAVSTVVSLWIPLEKNKITLTAAGENVYYLGAQGRFRVYNNVEEEGRWYHTRVYDEKEKKNYFALMYNKTGDLLENEQTKEITASINTAEKSTLLFKTGPDCGRVTISWQDCSKTISLNAPKDGILRIELAAKNEFSIKILFIRLSIFFLSALLMWLAYCLVAFNTEKIKNHLVKYSTQYLYLSIACLMFVFLAFNSGAQALRVNEMYQIGYIRSGASFKETLSVLSDLSVEMAPPLFTALAFLFYRILPYGTQWVLLLPELITALAAFFIGLACKNVAGKNAGFLATVFYTTSTVIITECGFEYRTYCLYLLTATLVFYFYTKRFGQRPQESWKSIIACGISMAALAYSHYYGVVICALMFLIDLFLYIKRKISLRCVVSYLIAGGTFLIWFFAILKGIANRAKTPGNWWMEKPGTLEISKVLYFLSGTVESDKKNSFYILFAMLVLGIAAGVMLLFKMRRMNENDEQPTDSEYIMTISSVMIVALISVMYLITRYGPLAIFIERYFIGLMPFAVYLMAKSTSTLFEILDRANVSKLINSKAMCAAMFIILAVCANECVLVKLNWKCNLTSPYRAATITLQGSGNSYADKYMLNSTCIISSNPKYPTYGWEDFYIREKGKLDAPDIISVYNQNSFFSVLKYDHLFVLKDEYELSEEFNHFLSAYYKTTDVSSQIMYCEKIQTQETD